MDVQEMLREVLNKGDSLTADGVLSLLLPPKSAPGSVYSLEDVNARLTSVRDEIEAIQRDSNDQFDAILASPCNQDNLNSLNQNFHKTQLDIMKLECDIAFAKEQFNVVNTIRNNNIIKERRDIIHEEESLRKSLRLIKFQPLKLLFDRLTDQLSASRDSCPAQASPHHFDWNSYHKAVSLLRNCGRAIIDIDKFERLYQSDLEIKSISSKQPLELFEFQDSHIVESQLVIKLEDNQNHDINTLLSNLRIGDETKTNKAVVFEETRGRLGAIAVGCCKLIIEQNMNYIDAHLTDGVQIEKLNNGEGSSEGRVLPLYAFSPQEYITQIGQHLLTLRKQTEQFDGFESDGLRFGLQYLTEAQDIPIDVSLYKTVTEIIVRCIARLCIRSLLARTNHSIISKLSANGRRQLATDALYLDNVLEDMGLLDSNEPNVQKFKSLLMGE